MLPAKHFMPSLQQPPFSSLLFPHLALFFCLPSRHKGSLPVPEEKINSWYYLTGASSWNKKADIFLVHGVLEFSGVGAKRDGEARRNFNDYSSCSSFWPTFTAAVSSFLFFLFSRLNQIPGNVPHQAKKVN